MKRIKTLTEKTMKSTVVKVAANARHLASQHVRQAVQLVTRAARTTNYR